MERAVRGFAAALALAAGLVGVAPARATPQRARVDVGLCTLEAPAGAEKALRALSWRAPAILSRVAADLGCRPAARYRFVLIPPGPSGDPAIDALDAMAPPWAAGYVIRGARVGAIRVAQAGHYPYGTLESVLAHEASHVLLQDAVPNGLPLWFEEAVATREGRRWSLEDMLNTSTALLTSDLPSFAELDPDFHASEGSARRAYAASFSFLTWATRRHGDSLVRDVVREARRRPFVRAWAIASGSPLADAERDWRREALLRYRWVAVLTASSTLWLGLSLLALIAGMRRRARARAARARWEEAEQRQLGSADADAGGVGEESPPS